MRNMQETLTIVENKEKVKIEDKKFRRSTKQLKEGGSFNNKLLSGMEIRKKLRASFHEKIRVMTI